MEKTYGSEKTDTAFEYLIHQATGMIMVQTQLGPNEARLRLEQAAQEADIPAYRLAEDVIGRRVTFN